MCSRFVFEISLSFISLAVVNSRQQNFEGVGRILAEATKKADSLITGPFILFILHHDKTLLTKSNPPLYVFFLNVE